MLNYLEILLKKNGTKMVQNSFTLINHVPIENISKALGHSTITQTQKYSNQKALMGKKALDTFLGIVKPD